jgi:hypothetical protein
VVVEDPVVLAADEACHRRRRNLGEDVTAIAAERLEILEQVVVVAALFVDVLLEVLDERRPDRVARRQPACLLECGFRQRHRRADDLMLDDQVLRPEVRDARMQEQGPARVGVWTDRERDLRP